MEVCCCAAVSSVVQSLVCTALRLLKQHLSRYGGYVGAYLVLGGVDKTGPRLFTVHAHGSSDSLPYVTMGEWGGGGPWGGGGGGGGGVCRREGGRV